ncbi:Sir2 family NAD-dependent protein deacetylase [Campylobacter sp. 19-13652]|uniref:SIR2 family NAD-dependent protein deacylase n=1 Tax=Campylobacter sp. 19-13652 TaxID=2840180 RepID=UPI001C765BB7|nr:Sir2 family NAD-dependent protein deacetylase [Campylobacter sp. 19-13652]BCX78925.1 NAD-dependent protein deacylase [Campylobacter sp. 19-13652]
MKKVLIISGAGLSAASGIKTFRDSDGLWENHDVMEICSTEGFMRNRQKVLDFYDARRAELAAATPNYAHIKIAELKAKYGEQIVVITQNIDDLLERAGCADVVHLHGFLPNLRCESCGEIWRVGYDSIRDKICPKCASSRLRHDVVMFGEMAPEYERMYREASECTLFIAIGTSGEVIDIASFAKRAPYSILNNLEKSRLDRHFDTLYIESAVNAVDKIARDIEEFLRKD